MAYTLSKSLSEMVHFLFDAAVDLLSKQNKKKTAKSDSGTCSSKLSCSFSFRSSGVVTRPLSSWEGGVFALGTDYFITNIFVLLLNLDLITTCIWKQELNLLICLCQNPIGKPILSTRASDLTPVSILNSIIGGRWYKLNSTICRFT